MCRCVSAGAWVNVPYFPLVDLGRVWYMHERRSTKCKGFWFALSRPRSR